MEQIELKFNKTVLIKAFLTFCGGNMRKFAVHSVLILLIMITILLGSRFTPQSLAASPASFTLRVFPGFHQQLAPSTWIPITIELETFGEPLTGELVIELPQDYILTGEATTTEYIIALDLPALARRTYHTTVFNPAGAYSSPSLKVYSQDKLVFQQVLELEPAMTGRGVLIVSDHEFYIESATINQPVFQLEPGFLPKDPAGYWGVEAVILDRAELTLLTSQQIEALAIWVRQGRTIILTGGNTRQALTSPLIKRLTSYRIKYKTVLPLTGDEDNALAFPDNLPWLEVFQVDPGAAEVLLTMQGTPLLLKETIGAGACYFLAFDPFAPPLASWSARADLFKVLLSVPGREGENNHGTLDHLLPELLRSTPQTLPSKLWALGTVAGLCFLLYLYFRLTPNLKLIPALSGYLLLIVIFSGLCSFTFNRLLADDQQSLSELAIIHKGPQHPTAQIEGYYSLFARKTSGLELTMNRTAGALTALSPQAGSGFSAPLRILIEEERSKLLFPPDDNWRTLGFRANYLTELPVYVETKDVGNLLEVQITNTGELLLERLLLYSAGRWYVLGQVAPGATGFFRADLTAPGENFATGILLYPQSWGRRTDPVALRRELLNVAADRLLAATSPNRRYLLSLLCGEKLSGSVEQNKPGQRSFSGLWLLPVD